MAESTLVRFLPAKGKLRFDAVFCLVAILANLILPLAHQCHCHLHALEELNATTPIAAGQEITLRVEAGESDEGEPHSHHHPASCPLCQEALRAGWFTIPTIFLSSGPSVLVQRFCHNVTTSLIVNPNFLVSRPRSPPIPL